MRTTFFLLILAAVMAGSLAKAQQPPADKAATQPATTSITVSALTQERAIAEVKAFGGEVRIDKEAPGSPVILVYFPNTKITDAGLVPLKAFTQLQTLNLWGPGITDAGLEHLKGLTQLQMLGLERTDVTDQGVKKLQVALPNCEIVR